MRFLKSLTLAVALLASVLTVGPQSQAQISGPGVSSVPVMRKIAASAIPFIISPTGTMGNNGADTLGTALPTTYANAYIYLPAGAIATGVPAAATWYFAQCSSTTACTVFNNTYTSGVPSIPGAPTAFVTTGPGAYTGVTGNVVGQQITIPAGTLGPNGVLRLSELNSVPNNADTKVLSATFSGVVFWASTQTTTNGVGSISTLMCRGAQNSSVVLSSSNQNGVGVGASANQFLTTNFAVAQTLSFNLNSAVATDFVVLEFFFLEATTG